MQIVSGLYKADCTGLRDLYHCDVLEQPEIKIKAVHIQMKLTWCCPASCVSDSSLFADILEIKDT